jgi:putative acetyltransferase
MKTVITVFNMGDYDQVIALWKASEGIGLSEADSQQNIARYLERNPNLSFVAKDENEQVIGAVLSGHDGRRGYVHHLAIHPKYRKQGIGQALTEKCLQALRSIGIQKCHLFVYTENEPAKLFWNRIGWIKRDDIFLMSKDL